MHLNNVERLDTLSKNGCPRYAIHHTYFFTNEEWKNWKPSESMKTYDMMVKRSKEVGGRKYNKKNYPGYIVIETYNIADTVKKINELLKNSESK